MTRVTQYGQFVPGGPPRDVVITVQPTSGFTTVPALIAPPSSIVSGQNVWIEEGELRPRDRLASFSTGNPGGSQFGATVHYDSRGTAIIVAFSHNTLAFLGADLQWSVTSYTSSHGSSYFTSFNPENVFSGSAYLPRVDENVLFFSNNSDPVLTWQPTTGVSSIGTEVPICRDLVGFDDRLVAWNIRELSGTTRFVQRAQWCVAADPEDWTGVGSGSQDLLDMRGEGTRVLVNGDELVLGSTAEIWFARKVGLPFVFDFAPLDRSISMPFPRAVLPTPWGIFWLGADFMIYQMIGHQIQPVGVPVQEFLRARMAEDLLSSAFFSHHPGRRTVTFYYTPAPNTTYTHPNRAITFHLDSGTWTAHSFWAGANAAGVRFAATLAYNVQYPTTIFPSP